VTLLVERHGVKTRQEITAMEGLEDWVTHPAWSRRVQRGFVGNRLERNFLARAYELIAPFPQSLDRRHPAEAAEGGSSERFTLSEEGGES